MNCPRCKTPIERLTHPDGVVTCPGCGSRLMTRAAALRSQGGIKPASTPPGTPAVALRNGVTPAAQLPPSATLPPTPARLLKDPSRPPAAGSRTAVATAVAAAPASAPAPRAAATAGAAPLSELAVVQRALDAIMDEVRSLREGQDRILDLLRSNPASSFAARPSQAIPVDGDEPVASQIRARQRKTVLLIDDDPQTRDAAVAELQQADVPVRAFDDGNAALSAIAAEKPDVIVIELALGGEMAGKDVINMIKATMEWVDVPIVLWTREPVSNQREARLIHGADEIVPKSAGAAALLTRVISVFRRG